MALMTSAVMPTPTRRVSPKNTKSTIPCYSKRHRKQSSDTKPKMFQQASSVLVLIHHDEGEDRDEQTHSDDLLKVSTSIMEEIFCGDFGPSLTSFPTKAGGCESRAMDFFVNYFAPAQQTLRIAVNANLYSSNPLTSAVFPLALHHEELFHAVVAMSLCSMESKSFYESDGHILDRPSKDVFYHRQCALSFLRNKLTPPYCHADNAALLTTTALILLDGILGDTNSLRVHCQGLRQMVASMGGIDSPCVDRLLRHFILQCDYCWSLEAGLPVAFTLPKLRIHNPFEAIPSGFQAMQLSRNETAPLVEIIARMHGWTVSVSNIINGTQNLEHQGLLFSYSPCYDTMDVLSISKAVEATTRDTVATALCLALILISQNFYGKGRFYHWYRRIRQQLTDLLFQIDLCNTFAPDQRCLVWIWMVAVESWRISSCLLPQGHELMRSLLYQSSEAGDWQQLGDLLKCFLWYESLGMKWQACWEEGMVANGFDGSSDDSTFSISPPSHFSTPSACARVPQLS